MDDLIDLGYALGLAMISGGYMLKPALTDEEKQEIAARKAQEIAERRANSPEVAKAEAKRARKAAKLRKQERKEN